MTLILLVNIRVLTIVTGVLGVMTVFASPALDASVAVCQGDAMRIDARGTPAAKVLKDIQTTCGIRFDGVHVESDRPVYFSQSGTRQDALRSLLHILNVKSYALEYRNDLLIQVTVLPDSVASNSLQTDSPASATESAEKPFADGLRIIGVIEGSQADLADLREGDLILSYDGQRVTQPVDLVRLSRERSTQEGVELIVIREREPIRVFLNGGFIGIRIQTGRVERILLEKYLYITE